MAESSAGALKPTGAEPPSPSGGAGRAAKQVQLRSMIQAIGMLPVLPILCGGFHNMTEGRFFTGQNLSIVAQQASIKTVLAAGMTFAILTGCIDLSVGSIVATCAARASFVPGGGVFGIAAGLLMGTFVGLINGVLIAGLRWPPFIVTLGSLT